MPNMTETPEERKALLLKKLEEVRRIVELGGCRELITIVLGGDYASVNGGATDNGLKVAIGCLLEMLHKSKEETANE